MQNCRADIHPLSASQLVVEDSQDGLDDSSLSGGGLQVIFEEARHKNKAHLAPLTGPEVAALLKLGTRVVRGPDWKWGDQVEHFFTHFYNWALALHRSFSLVAFMPSGPPLSVYLCFTDRAVNVYPFIRLTDQW